MVDATSDPAKAQMSDDGRDNQLNEDVLLQAWAKLAVYDQTATALKNQSIERRQVVIVLTATATVFAVLTGIIRYWQAALAFSIIAVSLPIIGTYLMNDIIKFTGTTDWIKYRYTAEMMRMHIYLYRMKAERYAEAKGPIHKMDSALSDALREVRESVKWDGVLPPTVKEAVKDDAIKAFIVDANFYTPRDNGLSEINIDDYMEWRVDDQKEWYDRKVGEDFEQMKLFFRLAQVALLAGSLAGGLAGYLSFDLVTIIAITNAIAAALTSWSNTSLYGTTYSIFRLTSQQLSDIKMAWTARLDDEEMQDEAYRKQETARFAQEVENILLWEREEWYELMLQTQAANDKVILEDLKHLSERAETTRKQGMEDDPADAPTS
jgi:hypothetical protein